MGLSSGTVTRTKKSRTHQHFPSKPFRALWVLLENVNADICRHGHGWSGDWGYDSAEEESDGEMVPAKLVSRSCPLLTMLMVSEELVLRPSRIRHHVISVEAEHPPSRAALYSYLFILMSLLIQIFPTHVYTPF